MSTPAIDTAATAPTAKCEFCREPVADDALVCPHCRKATATGRDQASRRRLKILGLIIAIPIIGIILLLIVGSELPPPTNPVDDIQASCDRQFGAATVASSRCKIVLMEKLMDDKQADQLREAARGAGVKPN